MLWNQRFHSIEMPTKIFSMIYIFEIDVQDIVFYCKCQEAKNVYYKEAKEEYEIYMVLDADTIIQPWTVMIHTFDASIANVAMF